MNKKYYFKSEKFESIKLPTIQEKRGKDWVDYGSDNLYPQLLVELYNNSAMHHTAIEAICDGVVGNGFKYFGETMANSHGETYNEVFEKVTKDYELFGGYSLNVIWSRDGQSIAEFYHLPFNNVRSGLMNEEEKVEDYWYCSDWTQYRKYKPVSYAAFSTTDNEGDRASQVFYYYNYTAGQYYYPLPSYVGAINDIDTDARISRFHANNLKNGLAPSMMLTFKNGTPTPDEQDEIWRDIKSTFAGEESAGQFFLNFAEPGREPVLQAIENANDDYYVTLETRLSSRILTAHRITSPLLVGIRDSGGGLGSNTDEILTAYGHFLGTVIIPDRKKLVSSFNKIVNLTGKTIKLEIENSAIIEQVTKEETIESIEPNKTEE